MRLTHGELSFFEDLNEQGTSHRVSVHLWNGGCFHAQNRKEPVLNGRQLNTLSLAPPFPVHPRGSLLRAGVAVLPAGPALSSRCETVGLQLPTRRVK